MTTGKFYRGENKLLADAQATKLGLDEHAHKGPNDGAVIVETAEIAEGTARRDGAPRDRFGSSVSKQANRLPL